MSYKSKAERALSESFGYDADGSWESPSKSSAVIVPADWALEYPHAMPPKVHVGSW